MKKIKCPRCETAKIEEVNKIEFATYINTFYQCLNKKCGVEFKLCEVKTNATKSKTT